METIVRLLAPRSRFGFVVKCVCLLISIVVAVIVAEIVEEGGLSKVDIPAASSVALAVGLPFVLLILKGMAFQANLLEKLDGLAFKDELTGLGNRRFLSKKFDQLVRLRKEEGGELAALHIDLDRFKQINDTIGHAAGDQVLVTTANRIRKIVRANDVAARVGGDEFVVLLHVPAGSKRPATLAKSLLVDLSRPSIFDGKECRIGASVGIASSPPSKEEELLTNSDIALYKAKRGGRGRLGIFNQEDLDELRQTKEIADDILRGIEEAEFTPHYQPQVDAKTGQVVAIEVLARWYHPRKGVLKPSRFLPAANELNVAADIDRMIFEKAIRECQSLFVNLAELPSLSFNVCANRIRRDEVEHIRDQVQAYGGGVSFELLETVFLEEESEELLFRLDLLRDLGIVLEVDDFGSGRASVIALQRIAPDRLKLDRRLVAPAVTNEASFCLLRSIVDIGVGLGIGVTAEGIETQEQAEILTSMGCDRLQGFFVAKPMCFDDLIIFLEGQNEISRDETLSRCYA